MPCTDTHTLTLLIHRHTYHSSARRGFIADCIVSNAARGQPAPDTPHKAVCPAAAAFPVSPCVVPCLQRAIIRSVPVAGVASDCIGGCYLMGISERFVGSHSQRPPVRKRAASSGDPDNSSDRVLPADCHRPLPRVRTTAPRFHRGVRQTLESTDCIGSNSGPWQAGSSRWQELCVIGQSHGWCRGRVLIAHYDCVFGPACC